MRAAALLLAVIIMAAGCGDSDDAAPATTTAPTPTESPTTSTTTTTTPTTTVEPGVTSPYVPTDVWETVDATEVGFDPDALASATRLAEERRSHCLLVLHDGRIVHEWYADGVERDDDFEVFSVTKSVTAAIVGAAVTEGLVDVGDEASELLDEWVGTDSEPVTIESILQNLSGRLYEPVPDLFELSGRPDMTTHSIDLAQQHAPGTVWAYNQSAIQTLDAIIERSSGEDTEDFAQAALFEPLGMSVSYPRDPAGNVPMFAGLQAGCRDLGRFALMSARLGAWGDEHIVDEAFMAAAVTGTAINEAYGYLYWHNAEPGTWDHTNPARDRSQRFWPDLPIDAFGANGLGEQFATIFPSEDLIVVRIGDPAGVQGYDGVLSNDLGAAVLAALD
ncbi:MAG: serine hydrolase [Actinomycetota bacterium]